MTAESAKRIRTVLIVLLGIGIFFGAFFGLAPGRLIDYGLAPIESERSAMGVWYFVLFSTFYGYLSLVAVIVWLLVTAFWGPLRRRRTRQKILSSWFGNGEQRVGYDTFHRLTGLTEEETRRIFGDARRDFNFADYQKAGAYLKSLGIRIEERLMERDPGAVGAP